MAVLVTGGAGYIGSHTVLELLKRGEEVVVIDNLQKGHKGALFKNVKFFEGDLRNSGFLDQVFTEKIDTVVHFAADSLVEESMIDPLKYYDNNVGSAISLLKAMSKYGVKRVVFSSTAAVYGEPEQVPIPETLQVNPSSPYGETKLAIERMLKWADQAYGIQHIVLRYFNVAGADLDGKLGEDHEPETHLIPIVLQVALGKREKIMIFGDDYNTADGSCIRDYIHVTDLADAHILAIKRLRDGGRSSVYNLGNGKGFSVKEVIEISRKVTGMSIPAEVAPRRPGDPAILVASSVKVTDELGWKPKYSGLETMIESAWNWFQKHPAGFTDK
jgi:UDP-glucose 4-epimerase